MTEITGDETVNEEAMSEPEAAPRVMNGEAAPIPPLPPAIGAAVIKVMSGLKRLQKTETNKQGGYDYAGVIGGAD